MGESPDELNKRVEHLALEERLGALAARWDELELELMVAEDEATGRGAFTVSVDLVDGNTTGSSPADQARTIAALARAEVAAETRPLLSSSSSSGCAQREARGRASGA